MFGVVCAVVGLLHLSRKRQRFGDGVGSGGKFTMCGWWLGGGGGYSDGWGGCGGRGWNCVLAFRCVFVVRRPVCELFAERVPAVITLYLTPLRSHLQLIIRPTVPAVTTVANNFVLSEREQTAYIANCLRRVILTQVSVQGLIIDRYKQRICGTNFVKTDSFQFQMTGNVLDYVVGTAPVAPRLVQTLQVASRTQESAENVGCVGIGWSFWKEGDVFVDECV